MAESSDRKLSELQDQLRQGAITRRDFVRYASILGVSLAVAEALAACGSQSTPEPCPTCPPAPTCPPQATCPTAAPCPAVEPCPECEVCPEPAPAGWGMENYSYPSGTAWIEPVEMNCVGCGACEMACSMKHFGVINREWSRVSVMKFLLPLPKAIQVTCVACQTEERECEKSCPVNPPAITWDSDLKHMVVDADRCAGKACLACVTACNGGAVKFDETVSDVVFVCDLCDVDRTGVRDPECIKVCPYNALRFRNNTPADKWRMSADEKADRIATRLYPLPKTAMGSVWRM